MPTLEQFVRSLKKSENSSEFTALISMIAEIPLITEDSDEYNDPEGKTKYYNFLKSGMVIGFRLGILTYIHFYMDEREGYQPYKEVLIKNIDASSNENEVMAILGSPNKLGGGKLDMLIGYIYKWIKYDFKDYSIRFEFKDNLGLRLISIN